jgi:transcriptional regulator with XRE-family HTH domain
MPKDLPPLSIRQTIGAIAREARLRLGLTQEDVADRLGIVTEVYGRLERGGTAPSVYTFRKLCLALNLSADVALELAPDRVPEATSTSRQGDGAPSRLESKYLRLILRRARRLTPQSLHLVSQITAALPTKPTVKPKPPRD